MHTKYNFISIALQHLGDAHLLMTHYVNKKLNEMTGRRRLQVIKSLLWKSSRLRGNTFIINQNTDTMELFLCEGIMCHYHSYDKAVRPNMFHITLPVLDPALEHSTNDVYRLTGFWHDKFK